MPTIWSQHSNQWRILPSKSFGLEAELHRLIEETPQMLPLAGQPEVVVIGSEVPLQNGSMDLLMLEDSGRFVIVEVKLAKNHEARRAVVAQALSYAAFLRGMTLEDVELAVSKYLRTAGFESIAACGERAFPSGAVDAAAFTQAMRHSLENGEFRLVFVLDSVPDDLLRLLGYLDEKIHGLQIDVIAISAYQVNDSTILLPQRMEPGKTEWSGTAPKMNSGKVPGPVLFENAVNADTSEFQTAYRRLLGWVAELEKQKLARIFSWSGKQYVTILPYLNEQNSGLVSLYYSKGKPPSVQLWRSVFETSAPASIALIEQEIGKPLGQGTAVAPISERLYELLSAAYRCAAE